MSSLTAEVKDELARVLVAKPATRGAEIATTLRFAGGLHLIGGKIVVEAELDTMVVARRLREGILEVFGVHPAVEMIQGTGIKRGNRYIVRVVREGEALARRTGIIDMRGRPVRGLPPAIVQAGPDEAIAAWRGAFLAHGSLTEPGRSCGLEITCPGPEAALALVGAARRVDITAKSRDVRGVDRVVVRDGDAIARLITLMGAETVVEKWQEYRAYRENRGTANRLANFDDANLRRSVRAAVAAGARVERAFEIIGEEIPAHLRKAGELRIVHKHASLEELGQLSTPPLTKDAVAGRIRRLIAMADKRAEELGIPPTAGALENGLIEDLGN